MTRRIPFSIWPTALAVTLAVTPSLASSQAGPPPGAPQGPPPGQLQLPPGASGGPPPGAPPPVELTPAQKIVAALPPPGPGGLPPRPPLPADAAMPSADPRDLQGTWVHDKALEFRNQKDMYGALLPYTMEGAKVLSRRVNSLKVGKPFLNASAICRPPGAPWQHDLNFPFQVIQTRDYAEFIFEEYHGRWHIALDGTRTPLPAGNPYMGRSVAHWDGGTLVIETSAFKQALWLDVDGTPFSASGKLVQRIRKVSDGGAVPYLEIVTTVIDPVYYTTPWSMVRSFAWAPHQAVFAEYNCEEQVGDPSVRGDAGLVPEPKD